METEDKQQDRGVLAATIQKRVDSEPVVGEIPTQPLGPDPVAAVAVVSVADDSVKEQSKTDGSAIAENTGTASAQSYGVSPAKKGRQAIYLPAAIGISLTVVSFALGLLHRFILPKFFQMQYCAWVGHSIVAAWIIGPPLWFSIEWYLASSLKRRSKDDLEILAHTHEVTRNVWVAFVVILAALFRVSWNSFGG